MFSMLKLPNLLANTTSKPGETSPHPSIPITDESLEGLLGDPAYSRPQSLQSRTQANESGLFPTGSLSTRLHLPVMSSPPVETQPRQLSRITDMLMDNDREVAKNGKKIAEVAKGMEMLEDMQAASEGKLGEILEVMCTVEDIAGISVGLDSVKEIIGEVRGEIGTLRMGIDGRMGEIEKCIDEGNKKTAEELQSLNAHTKGLTERMVGLEAKFQQVLAAKEEESLQSDSRLDNLDSKLDALIALVTTLSQSRLSASHITTAQTSDAGSSRHVPALEGEGEEDTASFQDWSLPEVDVQIDSPFVSNDGDAHSLERYFDPSGGVNMQDVLPRQDDEQEMDGVVGNGDITLIVGDEEDGEVQTAGLIDTEQMHGDSAAEPGEDVLDMDTEKIVDIQPSEVAEWNGPEVFDAEVDVIGTVELQTEIGSEEEEILEVVELDELEQGSAMDPEESVMGLREYDAESKHDSSGSNRSDILRTPTVKARARSSSTTTSDSPRGLRRRLALRQSAINYAADPLMDYKNDLKRKGSVINDDRSLKRSTRVTSLKSGRGRSRQSKGPHARLSSRPLGVSSGEKRGTGKWPKKGENTVKGQIQDVQCEQCKGNVHWACAGLMDDDNAPEDDWICPDCQAAIKAGTPKRTIEIAPPLMCIRADCIKRLKQRIVRKEHDEDEYVVERLIGRRATGRRPDSSRIFEHLVKWVDWGVASSTWEPEENLKYQAREMGDFVRECEEKGIDTKKRVTLLLEAKTAWNEEGELKE